MHRRRREDESSGDDVDRGDNDKAAGVAEAISGVGDDQMSRREDQETRGGRWPRWRTGCLSRWQRIVAKRRQGPLVLSIRVNGWGIGDVDFAASVRTSIRRERIGSEVLFLT